MPSAIEPTETEEQIETQRLEPEDQNNIVPAPIDPIEPTPTPMPTPIKLVTVEVPVEVPEVLKHLAVEAPEDLKHPLENVWGFWLNTNENKKNWTENQKELSLFDTVEDYWW